jgi:hypothetical protein
MTTTAGRVYAGLRPGTTTDSLRVADSNGALADHLACFAPKPGTPSCYPLGRSMPSAEAISCSCRRLSVRARSGRARKRPCWKSAYLDRRPKSARRERETIDRLRPGRHPGAEQNGP